MLLEGSQQPCLEDSRKVTYRRYPGSKRGESLWEGQNQVEVTGGGKVAIYRWWGCSMGYKVQQSPTPMGPRCKWDLGLCIAAKFWEKQGVPTSYHLGTVRLILYWALPVGRPCTPYIHHSSVSWSALSKSLGHVKWLQTEYQEQNSYFNNYALCLCLPSMYGR